MSNRKLFWVGLGSLTRGDVLLEVTTTNHDVFSAHCLPTSTNDQLLPASHQLRVALAPDYLLFGGSFNSPPTTEASKPL